MLYSLIIFIPLLVPSLVAPASIRACASSKVLIPPEAFTPIFLVTTSLIRRTSSSSTPFTPKPVEVFIKSAPDLSISASGIYFNNAQPSEGDTVRIYAKIWNNGLKDATSANVTFWDGDPAKGGVFIDNVISQFASGYMTVRFVDWKAAAGKHTSEAGGVAVHRDDLVVFA